jgi:hypothetical protein
MNLKGKDQMVNLAIIEVEQTVRWIIDIFGSELDIPYPCLDLWFIDWLFPISFKQKKRT